MRETHVSLFLIFVKNFNMKKIFLLLSASFLLMACPKETIDPPIYDKDYPFDTDPHNYHTADKNLCHDPPRKCTALCVKLDTDGLRNGNDLVQPTGYMPPLVLSRQLCLLLPIDPSPARKAQL